MHLAYERSYNECYILIINPCNNRDSINALYFLYKLHFNYFMIQPIDDFDI